MPLIRARAGVIVAEKPGRAAAGKHPVRHQIGVQRSAKKRLRLNNSDRLLWIWLSRVWTEWRSALVIAKPDTIIAWHRRAVVRNNVVGRSRCICPSIFVMQAAEDRFGDHT